MFVRENTAKGSDRRVKRKGKHKTQSTSIKSDGANNPAGTTLGTYLSDNKIPLAPRHHVVQVKFGKILGLSLDHKSSYSRMVLS